MLTKKHFKTIAEIISKCKDEIEQDGTDTSEAKNFILLEIVADFEDYFAETNPRFDGIKFRTACGF